MKNVLKHKGHLFTDYWKEDVALILKEVSDDLGRLMKSGRRSVKNLRHQRFNLSFKEVMNSATDGLVILKILPGRISDGFLNFKEDLLIELEELPDQKQKAIFSMKVIGALSSFTLSTVYNVKKGKLDFNFTGMKQANAFSRFIVGEIVFKLTRLLLLRFLNEVEKDLSLQDDLKHIRYFKELLASREAGDDDVNDLPHDPAIEIVENLKKYIMTGKR